MRLPATGLLAAVLLAGVAGCSLPEVLPLAGGTTSGPSPYGPWYEQHWATNSVLLAATDEPDGDIMSGDVAAFEEDPGLGPEPDVEVEVTHTAAAELPPTVEVKTAPSEQQATDFDSSSPYQFPSSAYAPQPANEPPAEPQVVPPSGGAIRY
jgi:hypothetical protein